MTTNDRNTIFGIRYERRAGQAFYGLCGVAVASLLINFQITYFIFTAIYLEHLAHRLFVGHKHDSMRLGLPFLFFLGLAASYWWLHGANVSTAEFLRTIELVLVFCGLLMVADAVTYNLNRFKSDFALMGVCGLVAMPLFLVIKIAYEFHKLNFSEIVENSEYLNYTMQLIFRGRRNLLVWINPNHADDIFLLLALASVIFSLLVVTCNHKWRFALVVVATVSFLTAAACFLMTKSSGGFAGLIVGIMVLIGLLIWRYMTRWKIELTIAFSSFCLLSLLVVGFVNIEKINTAVNNDSGKICSQAYHEIKRDNAWMKFKKSARIRLVLWSNGIEIWKNKPFFGHGHYDAESLASSYPELETCLYKSYAHSHSAYMDILIRGGLALLCVYVVTIFVVGRSLVIGFASSKGWLSVLFAGVVVYFFYLVVENVFDLSFVVSSYLKASLMNFTMLVTVAFFLLRKQLNDSGYQAAPS